MSYSQTSDQKFPPKPENCNFKIQLSETNLSGYEEVGVMSGCAGQKSLESYKSTIQPYVCKAGGDLVVARANGYGVFCQGSIFRKQ